MLPELPAFRTQASDQSESLVSEESDAKKPETPTSATSPRSELACDDDMPLPACNDAMMGIHDGVTY